MKKSKKVFSLAILFFRNNNKIGAIRHENRQHPTTGISPPAICP